MRSMKKHRQSLLWTTTVVHVKATTSKTFWPEVIVIGLDRFHCIPIVNIRILVFVW